MQRPTKVVTVCGRGNVRSAALAWELKDGHGIPAIPIGCNIAYQGAAQALYQWADCIVAMAQPVVPHIPEDFKGKMLLCDVGEDVYGNPRHEVLLAKCRAFIQQQGW